MYIYMHTCGGRYTVVNPQRCVDISQHVGLLSFVTVALMCKNDAGGHSEYGSNT